MPIGKTYERNENIKFIFKSYADILQESYISAYFNNADVHTVHDDRCHLYVWYILS